MNLLVNLFLLFQSLPVLLSYFKVYQRTEEIDENGNPWTGAAGTAPGVRVIHPTQAQAVIAGLGTAFAVRSLLK